MKRTAGTMLLALASMVAQAQVTFLNQASIMITPNRTLVSTVLMEQGNDGGEGVYVACNDPYCLATGEFIAPLDVVCPVPAGKTCTLEVSISGVAAVSTFDLQWVSATPDGLANSEGPVNTNPYYLVGAINDADVSLPRVSLAATWILLVKNTRHNQSHRVDVSLICADTHGDGCYFHVGGYRYNLVAFEKVNVYTP